MQEYAVIQTGGKQFRVQAGSILDVEKIDAEIGSKITLDNVLAISDGNQLQIGTPRVEKAKVSAEVVDHLRAPKVITFKKKQREGYKKTIGHRQKLTRLRVEKVIAG